MIAVMLGFYCLTPVRRSKRVEAACTIYSLNTRKIYISLPIINIENSFVSLFDQVDWKNRLFLLQNKGILFFLSFKSFRVLFVRAFSYTWYTIYCFERRFFFELLYTEPFHNATYSEYKSFLLPLSPLTLSTSISLYLSDFVLKQYYRKFNQLLVIRLQVVQCTIYNNGLQVLFR